jgi:hypothetical protein
LQSGDIGGDYEGILVAATAGADTRNRLGNANKAGTWHLIAADKRHHKLWNILNFPIHKEVRAKGGKGPMGRNYRQVVGWVMGVGPGIVGVGQGWV